MDRKRKALEETETAPQTIREKFFGSVSESDWNDWKWQLKNRLKNMKELGDYLELSEDEKGVFKNTDAINLPISITPYYLNIIDPNNPMDAIRKSIVPTYEEFTVSRGESEDPLGEAGSSQSVSNIVHRYPDRVLFLVTNFCSVNCRYCTRSRIFEEDSPIKRKAWQEGLDYIRRHPEVRDVLMSGGDPLTLEDRDLEYLLSELKAIPHVEFIRMGTKVPVVMPQRITPELLTIFKKYNDPLFLSIHFTHPIELTHEVKKACNDLANIGVPLGSQTVLLKGINDSSQILMKLFRECLRIRVRPYYLYQGDLILGSKHFRTTVAEGLQIMKELRGFTTGYAIPHYVIDAPGGGGKIPLLPDYYQGRTEEGDVILKNYLDKIYIYKE